MACTLCAVSADEHLRPGRPRLLRAINERAVLERLRAEGPRSRTELAQGTALSKPTVGQALGNLERAGLVRPAGQRLGERGRSALLYELDPTAAYVAGVDVGRSWVRVAVADLGGEVVGRRDERSRARSSAALVGRVHDLAREVVAEADVAWEDVVHTVVGSPGVLDPGTDRLRYASNLPGWSRPGLVGELRVALTPSLTIDNDTNLAALGERAYGRGRGVANFVYLSIGTGIGMGIVVGGELYRGARGAAGEVGFLPLAGGGLGPGAPPPSRARGGALEEAAAAGGVVRTGREMGLRGALTAERIFTAAAAGDPTALATVQAEADRLAVVVAAVAAIVDPELVVLGGGIGANAAVLLPLLEAAVEHLTPLRPEVVLSELGSEAIVLGAVATALDAARELVFHERAGDGRAG
jgi:predicted NBD/HSP70 family sugar kinase